jgi:hypothetical protein
MFHTGVNCVNGTGANKENRDLPKPNSEPNVLQPGTIQWGLSELSGRFAPLATAQSIA